MNIYWVILWASPRASWPGGWIREVLSPALNTVVLEQIHGFEDPASQILYSWSKKKPEALLKCTIVLSYYCTLNHNFYSPQLLKQLSTVVNKSSSFFMLFNWPHTRTHFFFFFKLSSCSSHTLNWVIPRRIK